MEESADADKARVETVKTEPPAGTLAHLFNKFRVTVNLVRGPDGWSCCTRAATNSCGAGVTSDGDTLLFSHVLRAKLDTLVWDVTGDRGLSADVDGRRWLLMRCEIDWAGAPRDGTTRTVDAKGSTSHGPSVATLCAYYEYNEALEKALGPVSVGEDSFLWSSTVGLDAEAAQIFGTRDDPKNEVEIPAPLLLLTEQIPANDPARNPDTTVSCTLVGYACQVFKWPWQHCSAGPDASLRGCSVTAAGGRDVTFSGYVRKGVE